MDLNLYLGLPRTPSRESDFGADLSLSSLPSSAEEIIEMSGREPASEVHAPYSPSHALITPSLPPVEPLNRNEETPIHHFDHVPYTPSIPSYTVQSSMKPNSSSHAEYYPCSPSDVPPSPAADGTGVAPLGTDAGDPSVHVPYSPSYSPISPPAEDNDEPVDVEGDSNHDTHVEHVPYSPSYAPMSPGALPSLQRSEAFLLEDVDTHGPYSPAYFPVSLTPNVDEGHSNVGSPLPAGTVNLFEAALPPGELLTQEDSSQRDLFQYPEFRLRRLIESSRRWPIRRFRSTVPYRTEHDFGTSSSRMEDRLLQDIIESSTEIPMLHKPSVQNLTSKDSEEEKEEQGNAVANFECNVCLDMAKEPVVTSCGHLFCWPCLYQWLYLHSDHKECPVCKGEVTDSNITPIYGRGNTETKTETKGGVVGDSGLKVPPRPHGRRVENLQRSRRSLMRTSREQFMSWRHIINEEIQNGNRAEGQESSQAGIFDGLNRRVLNRLLAAQQIQGESSSENGLNLGSSGSYRSVPEAPSNQDSNSRIDENYGRQRNSPLLRDRFDFWRRIALYSFPGTDAFASLASRMSSFLEAANNGNNAGPSTSANPQNHEPPLGQGAQGTTSVGDQPSASSTMGVIQGAGGALDASAELNSAGSSRSLRRRRRNLPSSSLDVDGQAHHARKRRRLN